MMNYQDEYNRQLKMTGIKLLHLLTSVFLFYIFWLLFRYGQVFPAKEAGFRYNYFIVAGFTAVLFFFILTP